VLDRIGRRRHARLQRALGNALEIRDAGITPPLRFLPLDGEELRDLRETFMVDVASCRPRLARIARRS
jgi:hypothetical protein